MAKRVKPVLEIPTITTTEQADAVLMEIAERKRQMELINLDFKEQVDALKKTVAAACEPIIEEIAQREQALIRFGEARKNELFSKKRSLELNFGTIGFRQSTCLKTLRKITWDQVLGLLKSSEDCDLTGCIRIKQEVDKDALKQLPPEKIAEAGCRLEQSDAFYYEINEAEIMREKA